MSLRVKELCKEKGITMKELAEKIGINPVTLTQSLNGNPTLSRLKEVATILDVNVADLFREPKPKDDDIHGCIYVNGEPNLISNVEDISKLLDKLLSNND